MKQTTINKKIIWEGIGLHTGERCKVTVAPASEGFGLKMKRVDLDTDSWIPCDVKYVSSTNRSTNLKSGSGEVATVEHLMSALYGLGVHNAEILVEGPEVPILDGSSGPFCDLLGQSEIVQQSKDARVFELKEVVRYQDETGAEYTAIPSKNLEIDVLIDFDSDLVGKSHAYFSESSEFEKDFAPARTFVFTEDVVKLARQGLIKGGQIDNAVVLRSENARDEDLREALKVIGQEDIDGVLSKINDGFEFKYDNELARHKLLDLLGDLALLGVHLKAKILAKKPGHTGNIGFARKLKEIYALEVKLKGKPAYDPDKESLFTTTQIKSYLPHRYPMLMVDKIIELSEKHVVGIKNLTINESLFQGHFPNNPIFPGVLQMEALAQTGGILALTNVENPSNWDTYFLKMNNVKFKRKVVPGDTLILKMELLRPIRRGIVHMQGTAYVGNHIVSEGELTAQIIDRTTLK